MKSQLNLYREIIDIVDESVKFIKKVDNDKEISDAYKDVYTTVEQRKRDKKVTQLLELYVKGYENKVVNNEWYKKVIFILCCSILGFFSLGFVAVIILSVVLKNVSIDENINQLITVCISFIALIIGILTIIVKYVFPEKEEEYITEIVKLIQENDLKNKIENIKVNAIAYEKEEKNDINIIEEIDEL